MSTTTVVAYQKLLEQHLKRARRTAAQLLASDFAPAVIAPPLPPPQLKDTVKIFQRPHTRLT